MSMLEERYRGGICHQDLEYWQARREIKSICERDRGDADTRRCGERSAADN